MHFYPILNQDRSDGLLAWPSRRIPLMLNAYQMGNDMMRRSSIVAVVTLLCLQGTWAFADVDSGPMVGSQLSPLKVRLVENGTAAELQDVVPAHAEHPTVYVFLAASRFDRPAAGYVRSVDGLVQELQRRDPLAGLVVIYLTDDAAAGSARVTAVQRALRLPAAHWSIFPEGENGPAGWGINDRAAVTTVLANGREVVARFGYDSVNDTQAIDLKRAIEKLKPE